MPDVSSGAGASVEHLRPYVAASATFSASRPLPNRTLKLSDELRVAYVTSSIVHILTPTFDLHPSINGARFMDRTTDQKAAALHAETAFPYAYTIISPTEEDHFMMTEFEVPANDTGLPLPSYERPVVREAEWSPSGLASARGCYLSILTSRLQIRLYEARPNGWTGAWREVAKLNSIPFSDHDRVAQLDLYILAHRWTAPISSSVPSGDSCTAFLLGSTRSGKLVAWPFRTGPYASPQCLQIAIPDRLQNHPLHLMAADELWKRDTRPGAVSVEARWCHLVVWSPVLREVVILRLTVSGSAAPYDLIAEETLSLESKPCCTDVRFVDKDVAVITGPGTVDVVDLSPAAKNRIRSFDLATDGRSCGDIRPAPNPFQVAVGTHLVKDKLQVVLADGCTFYIDLAATSAEPPRKTQLPTAVLTVEQKGEADDALQAMISIRRPITGVLRLSKAHRGDDSSGVLLVAQETTELAALPHRPTEHRLETVSLMLPSTFDPTAPAVDLDRSLSALLHSQFHPEQVEGPENTEYLPSHVFLPLTVLFAASGRAERVRLVATLWKFVQPLTTAEWTIKAPDPQLRRLCWLLVWFRRVSQQTSDISELKESLHRVRQTISGRNLRCQIQAAQKMVALDTQRTDDERACLIRVAAASYLTARISESNELGSMPGMVESLMNGLNKAGAFADWMRNIDTRGGIDLGESCPACDASILLSCKSGSLFSARCLQGHIWKRCSLTLAILSEQKTLLCTGCGIEAAGAEEGSDGETRGEVAGSWTKVASTSKCAHCGSLWAAL